MLAETTESAAAYADLRRRVTELLRTSATDEDATTMVPACPAWSVKDLAAHLCGVCDDILAGRIDGVATDPWTAAQVERFAGHDLGAILDAWDELGPQVEAIIPAFPPAPAAQMVMDATTHEHDLRGALGVAGGRDSDGVRVGLSFMFSMLDAMVRRQQLPALAVTTDGTTWTAGEGDPAVTLETTAFELFRSLGGRRSLGQIQALPWHGDPDPYLAVFERSPLRPPAEPLVE